MSDDALRLLERAARRGDPTDQARLLASRLRRGDLASDRIELAAYCGDERALMLVRHEEYQQSTIAGIQWWRRLVVPEPEGAIRYISIPPALGEWVAGLARWGTLALTRTARVAARAALEAWEPRNCPDCPACNCSNCPGCGGMGAEVGTALEEDCQTCTGSGRNPYPRRAVEAAESGDMGTLRSAMERIGQLWLSGLLAADYERPGEVVVPSVKDAARLLKDGEPEMRRLLEADLAEWALA